MSESGRLPTVGVSRHCLACRAPEPVPESFMRRPRCGEARTTHRGEPSGILGRVALGATWAFAALVLIVLGLIRWVGPSWWGVTMALFLPRWLYLGPLPVLARGAGTRGEWAADPATREGQGRGASGLPIRQRARSRPEGVRVRILSFNLGTVRIDARLLPRLIEQDADRPDCPPGRVDPQPGMGLHALLGRPRPGLGPPAPLAGAVLPGPTPGEPPGSSPLAPRSPPLAPRVLPGSQTHADSPIESSPREGTSRPARRPRNAVAPARSRR